MYVIHSLSRTSSLPRLGVAGRWGNTRCCTWPDICVLARLGVVCILPRIVWLQHTRHVRSLVRLLLRRSLVRLLLRRSLVRLGRSWHARPCRLLLLNRIGACVRIWLCRRILRGVRGPHCSLLLLLQGNGGHPPPTTTVCPDGRKQHDQHAHTN